MSSSSSTNLISRRRYSGRSVLVHATRCALILAALACCHAAAKPNVILVMTDDQGYGDLGAHGNPVLKTPHLDRLHAQSIRLTRFHAAPMCTPTRSQLMTGIDALRNGAMNVSSGRALLRTEFPTMPEIFAENGYRTGLFGKWHLGDAYPFRPQDRGFQKSIWLKSSMTPSAADYWNNDYFDDVYEHDGRLEPFTGYCTDVFFREAMRWMKEQADRDEPFFCYLPTNAPHGPFFVPDRYRKPYADQKEQTASFFGMIANLDENMGRLLQFLDENDLRDDTILIFMTDNGTAGGEAVFNAGMRGSKTSLYDGGHRVPFFIRWPAGKLREPSDQEYLAQSQDVLPSLIELCELTPPAKMRALDGLSLAPLLRGATDNLPDRKLVVQYSRMGQPRPKSGDAAVLWRNWRLVKDTELYDIAEDPGQNNDVAEEHPNVIREMRDHYKRWWSSVEPRVNEFSRIHIGSAMEPLIKLTPCDWQDVFLDTQGQIRRGPKKNGAWGLYVEKAGEYEFALRRWPFEADTAIDAAVPQYKGVDGSYREGTALPVSSARLRVGNTERSGKVAPGQKVTSFQLRLEQGPVDAQTWFLDANGEELCGAYYVYVRRVTD